MQYFMLGGDGKPYGPVPAETIREWYRTGRATLQTQVALEGSQSWQALGMTPEFQDLSLEAPPRPAPQPVPPPAPVVCGAATASLVCGIAGIVSVPFCAFVNVFVGLPAIICGHVARGRIARSGGTLAGGGVALAGLIMGYLSIVLTVVILLAVAGPAFMTARETSRRNACINNLRLIEGAKEQWALGGNRAKTDAPTMDQLLPYLRATPTCKAGGAYSPNDLNHLPTCTRPGHVLP